jgi:hypothetical protein
MRSQKGAFELWFLGFGSETLDYAAPLTEEIWDEYELTPTGTENDCQQKMWNIFYAKNAPLFTLCDIISVESTTI